MPEPKKSWFQSIFSGGMPKQGKLPNLGNSQFNASVIAEAASASVIAEAKVTEAEIFPHSKVYITEKYPNEVAILYVQVEGDNSFKLMGGNAEIKLDVTKPFMNPNISIGNSVAGENGRLEPNDIRVDINYFSGELERNNIEILDWLNKLYEKHDRNLCLIIVDQTSYEIPWEMLELLPSKAGTKYLGALVTTVRWRQVQKNGKNGDFLTLDMKSDNKSDKCTGRLIAYANKELNLKIEQSIFEQLSVTPYNDITKFQNHLQEEDDKEYGLIYIAAHGKFGEGHQNISFGSLNDTKQQLKLSDLYFCDLKLLEKSSGIVFINTCHSARQKPHSRISSSSNYQIGFVELFLRKGARGVIGTLGAVGNEYAAKIAENLIQPCIGSSSLSVATLLRNIRFQVAADLANKDTEANRAAFIYTFMYVYYGNPMTVLRLTPSGGQTDD
ncbi:MAG: hypothetical protein DCF19_10450 [Pseudanabaena frigida]|uniref:CHAT domain-containing protein n=1 Tax=Pseudanabaena frigida TaxID=945775 RepID=A0A2W4WGT7_9CYAN|nr:MAG: hypothetical protein DCF19_10450 [Pseudanabaena frigida]